MIPANPPRPYWQAEIWHDGRQVYTSGPIDAGTELRAAIPREAGSWMVVRWLTAEEAAGDDLDYEEMREGTPPP